MAVEISFSIFSLLGFYLSKEKKNITTKAKIAVHFIPSLSTHHLLAVAMVIKNLGVL